MCSDCKEWRLGGGTARPNSLTLRPTDKESWSSLLVLSVGQRRASVDWLRSRSYANRRTTEWTRGRSNDSNSHCRLPVTASFAADNPLWCERHEQEPRYLFNGEVILVAKWTEWTVKEAKGVYQKQLFETPRNRFILTIRHNNVNISIILLCLIHLTPQFIHPFGKLDWTCDRAFHLYHGFGLAPVGFLPWHMKGWEAEWYNSKKKSVCTP